MYDLYLNEISLAQTNFDSTTDNIVEISNSTIPDATGVASAVTAVATQSGGGRLSGFSSVTSSGGASFMTAAPMLGAGAMAALGLLAL